MSKKLQDVVKNPKNLPCLEIQSSTMINYTENMVDSCPASLLVAKEQIDASKTVTNISSGSENRCPDMLTLEQELDTNSKTGGFFVNNPRVKRPSQ